MSSNPGKIPDFRGAKTKIWLKVKVTDIEFVQLPSPFATLTLELDDSELPQMRPRTFTLKLEPDSDVESCLVLTSSQEWKAGRIMFSPFGRGAVAHSVEGPSKGPVSRCNSTDVGSNHSEALHHNVLVRLDRFNRESLEIESSIPIRNHRFH